jgi:hypothetical protein
VPDCLKCHRYSTSWASQLTTPGPGSPRYPSPSQ